MDIQIPQKSRTIIKQLHITCGDYRLSLPMIVRKEHSLHKVDHHKVEQQEVEQQKVNHHKVEQQKVDIRCTHTFVTLFDYSNSGESINHMMSI